MAKTKVAALGAVAKMKNVKALVQVKMKVAGGALVKAKTETEKVAKEEAGARAMTKVVLKVM